MEDVTDGSVHVVVLKIGGSMWGVEDTIVWEVSP
jgi:hypothetical protein